MTDIVDRLKAYAECNDACGLYTEANCAHDAIKEILRLREELAEKNRKIKKEPKNENL